MGRCCLNTDVPVIKAVTTRAAQQANRSADTSFGRVTLLPEPPWRSTNPVQHPSDKVPEEKQTLRSGREIRRSESDTKHLLISHAPQMTNLVSQSERAGTSFPMQAPGWGTGRGSLKTPLARRATRLYKHGARDCELLTHGAEPQ